MTYIDYQFEMLRGQIEELQGRLEEMLALRRGRAGMFGSLRGRSRRIRGRARQAVARARYGTIGFRLRLSIPGRPVQPQPKLPSPTRYVLLAAGVTLAATAVLWPDLVSSLWKQASEMMSRSGDSQNATQSSAEL